MKLNISLVWVKPLCIGAGLLGIVGLAAGNWVVGLCMLLGSYLFEQGNYRCPVCGKKLDMKAPLFHGARCPGCKTLLRK